MRNGTECTVGDLRAIVGRSFGGRAVVLTLAVCQIMCSGHMLKTTAAVQGRKSVNDDIAAGKYGKNRSQQDGNNFLALRKHKRPQLEIRKCSTTLGFILYNRRGYDKSCDLKNWRFDIYSPDFNESKGSGLIDLPLVDEADSATTL